MPAPDRFPSVDQVGFVVEDLQNGMDRYTDVLGVGPWRVYRFAPPDLTDREYRGERGTFSMDLAIGTVGGFMLELIEPTAGPSIYTEHLDAHGEGIHHVGCFTLDEAELEAAVEQYESVGCPVAQRGNFGDSTFVYLDTEDRLGSFLELGANSTAVPDPIRTYDPR